MNAPEEGGQPEPRRDRPGSAAPIDRVDASPRRRRRPRRRADHHTTRRTEARRILVNSSGAADAPTREAGEVGQIKLAKLDRLQIPIVKRASGGEPEQCCGDDNQGAGDQQHGPQAAQLLSRLKAEASRNGADHPQQEQCAHRLLPRRPADPHNAPAPRGGKPARGRPLRQKQDWRLPGRWCRRAAKS